MKKQIIILLMVFLAIVLVVFFVARLNPNDNSIDIVVDNKDTASSTIDNKINKNNPIVSGPKIELSKDLWTTFANYLNYASEHNLKAVAVLSYDLSDTCKDKNLEKECFQKMDTLYEIGSKLNKKDFVNVWEDDKQAILSTNISRPNTENELIAVRSTIIFIKDKDGYPKILALNPSEMWRVLKDKKLSNEENEMKISSFFLDTDKDGASDQLENCIFPDNILPVSCDKTDPNKRDSNGDGWWDGIGPMLSQ